MRIFAAMLLQVTDATAHSLPASQGDGSWQWVPVAGTRCMGGEETGIYVKYSERGNKNLGIYFHGGGACFNSFTCHFAATTDPHPRDRGSKGIFAARPDNPLDDYNWITIPYCTGDVHAGDAESPESFRAHRMFHGLGNLRQILDRAQQTFRDVETLFVTGESAGGFGAAATYMTTRSFFPEARGVLVDDSGPILTDEYLPACLQAEWKRLWNLNAGLPKDCACNSPGGNLAAAWEYGRSKFPRDGFGLISSVDDVVISKFFSFGLGHCKKRIHGGFKLMHEGLEALAATGVRVYMIPGMGHTHTSHDEFYTRTVQGIAMCDWVAQLIDPSQADPETVRPTSEDFVLEGASAPANASHSFAGILV